MVSKPKADAGGAGDDASDDDAKPAAEGGSKKRGGARKVRTADEMAGQQRDISVSEFFVKNRHLLGFDNPLKALLTTVKEGVDNALDACEEAGIPPEVIVEITRVSDLAEGGAATLFTSAQAEAAGNGNGKPGSAGHAAAATSAGDAKRSAVPAGAASATATAAGPAPSKSDAAANRLFQRTLFDADANPEPTSEEEEAAKLAKDTAKAAKGRKVTDPPERYVVAIEDNGPGIVQEQIGKVFGKLLYGSKFHRLRQSLTADQPVLVERDGRVGWTPIGTFVDSLLPDGAELADVAGCRIRVPAFDRDSGRYAWRPVSHVIRHPRANEVLEIRTECGKTVRVTGCHSLFTWDAGERRVREVEARTLRAGDHVVAPKRLPAPGRTASVNVLDHLRLEDVQGRQLFVYGVPAAVFGELRSGAEVVAIRDGQGRSRRHLRMRGRDGATCDVLVESFAQYERGGFLPARLVLRLGLAAACRDGRLRTYHHGRTTETPVTWPLTPALLRFLGLYVAEGHSDRRQTGFTFASKEGHLVDEVVATARGLGLSTTVEPRPRNAVRVKVFGGAIDLLLPAWCGKGARAKRVPPFVFSVASALRAHFLDGLYQGDGHLVPKRDVLMLGTSSAALVRDVETLWLLQGVIASRSGPFRQKGLGREPSIAWRLDVHGRDIDRSHVFARKSVSRHRNRYRLFPVARFALAAGGAVTGSRVATDAKSLLRAAGLGTGPGGVDKSLRIVMAAAPGESFRTTELAGIAGARVTRHLTDHLTRLGYFERHDDWYLATDKVADLRREVEAVTAFGASDLCLLRVRDVRTVEDADPFVYDLSVPGCENFVAGDGAIACHNSRGQQGIGISAAGMYGQLTTGKAVRIVSRTSKRKPAHYMEVALDLQRNQPDVRESHDLPASEFEKQGTRVEIELEAKYQKGQRSVDTYLRATALANPHVTIRYRDPEGTWQVWERTTRKLPEEPREIKPHPAGVELGMLLQMLKSTGEKKLGAFLEHEFSRVSHARAVEVCELAGLNTATWVARASREEATKLHEALGKVKFMDPATDCISPIGEGLLVDSLLREYPKAFLVAKTRSPAVYRGNPFQVEVALAHDPAAMPADQPVTLLRFANRVPLLYQQGACAVTKAVNSVRWKKYGVDQPRGALPVGPIVLVVHLASVWVPFTSESKEAVASYPEIVEEIRRAVMECGRALGIHVAKGRRQADELKKRDYIAKYIPKISEALQKILEFDDRERDRTTAKLTEVLNRRSQG